MRGLRCEAARRVRGLIGGVISAVARGAPAGALGLALLACSAGGDRYTGVADSGAADARPADGAPGTAELRLSTSGIAGATGAIAASPAGTSCGPGCLRFATRDGVTLTAAPTAGSYLHAWGGACAGNAPTCYVEMTIDRAVSATYSPPNLAFVTADPVARDPGDPTGSIDAGCQAAARAADLPGTYVGWLGRSAAAKVDARLRNASGWVRVDGQPFVARRADLLPALGDNPHSLYPLRVDERGRTVPATTQVLGATMLDECEGWTQQGRNATAGLAGGGWIEAGNYDPYVPVDCGSALPVYCLGTDHDVTVSVPHAAGRLAFVAALDGRPGGSGVAGLDAACASRASRAGLAGSYRALVATTTASAASRFSTAGPPWVRVDGVPVVASAADLFRASGPVLLAPLDTDEQGRETGMFVTTGADDFTHPGSAPSTCNDYTDTSDATGMVLGAPSFPDQRMISVSPGLWQCRFPNAVYCLQL